MAITVTPAVSLAENVKEEIRSPSTTTAVTLKLLRALLGSETPIEPAPGSSSNIRRDTTAPAGTAGKAGAKPVSRSAKAIKPRVPAKVVIYAVPETFLPLSTDAQKLKLATDIFNKTLKSLSDAAKSRNSPPTTAKCTQHPIPPRARLNNLGAYRTLQETSPNRHAKPLSPQKLRQKPPVRSLPSQPSLLTTAECARSALDCLRRLEKTDTETQSLQLDRGSLVLLENLNQLGLVELAVQEITVLRPRLDRRIKAGAEMSTRYEGASSGQVGHPRASLGEALRFDAVPKSPDLCNLVISFQRQMLKTLAILGLTAVDPLIFETLGLRCKHGPAAVILQGYKSNFFSAEKAALYLQALAQAISSLCSFGRATPTKASGGSLSPELVLQLQLAALEIQCRSWALTKAPIDLERGIWGPFIRTLAKFCQNTSIGKTEQYDRARDGLQRLKTALKTASTDAAIIDEPEMPTSVSEYLAKLAQDCGCHVDSIALLHRSLHTSDDPQSLSSTISHCKIATLRLQAFSDNPRAALSAAEEALSSLKGSIKGSARELEDLLLYGVRLRKIALDTLSKLEKSKEFAPLVEIQVNLRFCAIRILFSFLNFVARYIGDRPSQEASQAQVGQFLQKVHLARFIAEATITNTLSAARSAIDDSASMWADADSALNECHALAKTLDTVTEPKIVLDESRKAASTFLKISNVYWLRFLRCKETKDEPIELLKLLKKSTRVLDDRPEPEQLIGFLAVKYEKMASIYTEIQRDDKASEVLRRAISYHLCSPGFEEAIRHRSSKSMRLNWDSNTSTIFTLGKTLAAYVKLLLSSHQSKQYDQEFYEVETLPTEQRIALLERQFVICMTLSPPASRFASIAALARQILGLYQPNQTLHRVQFLLGVLKYSSLHHNEHMEDLLEEHLMDEKLCNLEHDLTTGASLSPCAMPLVASLRLQWAFKKSRHCTQLLRDMVDRWSTLYSDCEDWQTLESHLDDPSLLSSQLQAIIDFADMRSMGKLRLSALLLQEKMFESEKRENNAALARNLIQQGLQCSRLGATVDAGRALASAGKHTDRMDSQPAICLHYHLAHAEYLLNIPSFESCVDALEAARSYHAAVFPAGIEDGKQHMGLSQTRLLCQSASVASRWEFDRGNLSSAVFLAKKCVKLSSQIWAGIQKMQGQVQLRRTQEGNDSMVDNLAEDLSNTNISLKRATERPSTGGAAFWPYVSVHGEALMHLSYLLASCGLYQDAIYYAEQAQRVAQAVDSPVYVFLASTLLLAHRRKGDGINADLEKSSNRRPPLEIENASIAVAQSSVYLAEALVSAGELSAASEAIEEATKVFSSIDARHASATATPEIEGPSEASAIAFSTKSESKGGTEIPDKGTRKEVQAKRARLQGKKSRPQAAKSVAQGEPILLIASARFENTVNVLKAQIMLSSGKYQDAMSLLAMSKDILVSGQDLVRKRLIEIRTVLDKVFQSLSADAVHCVLAETTIAFPSLQKIEQAFGKQASFQGPVASKTPSRDHRPVARGGRRPIHHDTEAYQPSSLIVRAAELLMDAFKPMSGNCPTNVLREVCSMLNQCFMLSSVLLQQRKYNPMQAALQSATPNCSAMTRERSVIMADVNLTDKSNITSWSDVSRGDKAVDHLDFADTCPIEPGFLNKLPKEWNIVLMQLSGTRDELSITKLHAGQLPFSLRIPLHRSNSDEPDEEEFGFAAAKTELLDIINSANKTAHDSRGQSDKQAKKSWWAEREALDDRLKVLLENVENIWLGGFRGILTHQHRYQELLSSFSGSLFRSLDLHLPSRQKSRTTIGVESNLHAHVLDLFVALGHPDGHVLEDSVTDLLYFVVDVLQFQGEHNAYDEIDFDIITMEVLDALRCYHEALKVLDVKFIQHTILVLDNQLLAFPWESLPCLDGQPVSRMPSLSCIMSRLDKIRLQDADVSALSISAGNGAYILNPSSDLMSTQATFAGAFSTALPNYTSIVNRAPTEAEFESCLCEKDLFLYFGHGSGAQYVRGRNVRRLRRCAVTFLMGCSSGKMVECGAFEPYGVPWNYMHASSPAVVGTLWDVTDKDIDRFAMRTFTEWGLLTEDAIPREAAGAKRKGRTVKAKGKSATQPAQPASEGSAPKRKMALDEAITNARGSCVLRYLNGAAPVMYGIPVVLG